jgi:uncharacterized protein YndB with AHSA1/START domain
MDPDMLDPGTFDAGPLAAVSSEEHADGTWTVTFVRELAHPPERVWAAIVRADDLPRWAPFEPDRDLDATGPATLTMVDGNLREAIPSEVRVVDLPTRLEYTWGDDLLAWELAPTAAGTELTLRHTVRGKDWMPKVAAGWHLCLVVADHVLAGDVVQPIVGEDAMRYGWQDLHDQYAARLGVQGS